MTENKDDTRVRVIELLNTAAFLTSDKDKVDTLCQVQELVIHRDPTLLDSFFEEIVAFQTDRNADVRKFVVGFIEEACKMDHAMLPRLVLNIRILLTDEAISIVKRVVQAAAQLFKSTLTWLSSARHTTKEMDQTWEIITQIKNEIILMIDHDNDGVRTQAIKFLESLILTLTYTEPDSIQRKGDFSLDQVPLTLKIARPRKLEEEAKTVLSKLITFQGSLHISSVNLMTCMSSLSIIARARPQFMGRVVEALEILHANLPPTLTKSQVNSVRKHLKIQLLNLLRHTGAYDYQDNIVTILNDLNVGSTEIMKAMPSKEEIRKRVKRHKLPEERITAAATEPPKKKMRTEGSSSESTSQEEKQDIPVEPENLTAIDITQRWLVDRLKIDAVANLVMVTMLNLPDKLPPLFSVAYTPVTAAGSGSQIHHVARLLSSQLTAANLGPGAEKFEEQEKAQKAKEKDDSDSDEEAGKIPRLLGKKIQNKKELEKIEKPLMPSGIAHRPVGIWQKAKFVKLGEITQELSKPAAFKLQLFLLNRILNLDGTRLYGAAHKNRARILSKFSTVATYEELIEFEKFIFKDLATNVDLLQSWIYCRHSSSQDFNQMNTIIEKHLKKTLNEYSSYQSFILHIVRKITEIPSNKERDEILSRIVVESPSVPLNVTEHLLCLCEQGNDSISTLAHLLKDLIYWRPLAAFSSLNTLCSLMTHNNSEVRDIMEPVIIELIKDTKYEDYVIAIAKKSLTYLTEEKPPDEIFNAKLGRPDKAEEWTEDAIRASLFLVLVLLPHQQILMHDLAQVYVKTVNEAKRTILRYLEIPVSHMGMDSPTLLDLVETCPKGSETLITRIIHILTEKAPPSEELVCHVRELYNKRVSDVRFLIPVLTGLSKKEVIAVLPKLIKLNPHVVKEVFNRLWGVTLDKGTSPISPVELLVALHLIPTEKCDVKTIIKATGLCFSERNIYTGEVLAVVLQHLIEETTLPTLFMRTVIQTLTHHPKLLSFIMNILQRLITKQVWKQKKVWEGFIKCCQRSMPQSFTVLLQLPPPQLSEALSEAQDLQIKLSEHINNLTDSQRAHIPSSILEAIRNPITKDSSVIIENSQSINNLDI